MASEVKRYSTAILLIVIFTSTLITAQLATKVSGFNASAPILNSKPLPSASLAQTTSLTWSTQEVLTGGSFGTICMVLDSNNNPRIVHAGKDGMMYYTFWDGSNWKTQSIMQGGTPNALVLDSGNNPHILYKGSN